MTMPTSSRCWMASATLGTIEDFALAAGAVAVPHVSSLAIPFVSPLSSSFQSTFQHTKAMGR